jgi:hypothetical protein
MQQRNEKASPREREKEKKERKEEKRPTLTFKQHH